MKQKMMKRYLMILAAALAFTACDDMLDTTPKSTISPSSYFKSETDLQLFSNSLYQNLLDKELYRHESDQIFETPLSDEMTGGASRKVPASGGGWTWTDLRKINTLLAHIGNCDDAEAVKEYTGVAKFWRAYFYFDKVRRFGDVPWIDKEIGSADDMLYAPRDSREVIMQHMIEDIDEAIADLSDQVSVYRVNKWSALALKANFCLFEGTYRKYHNLTVEGGKDYTYYLEQAADAAKQVMDSGKYKLYTTGRPDVDYLNLFAETTASSDEFILAIAFSHDVAAKHNATWYGTKQTTGRAGFNKKIIDSYLMADGSRFTDKAGWKAMQFKDEVAGRDPRLAQTIRTPGYRRIGSDKLMAPDFSASTTGFQTIKFVQSADADADAWITSYNDLPVFRYAEVLLDYAEAKAELGTLTQADLEKSINLIRARAGMPDLNMATANASPDPYLSSKEYGYSNVTGANKGVILEIRRERTIELAQEGERRWYDLMRWKEGDCVTQHLYGMYFPGPGEYDLDGDGKADVCLYTGVKPASSAGQVLEIGKDIVLSDGTSGYVDPHHSLQRSFDENRDYLYPIPTDERNLNHNLTQNPGWDDGLDF